MPWRPTKTPQRIPPSPSAESWPAQKVKRAAEKAPPINLDPNNVTRDAYALQVHLNRLAEQFELMKAQVRQAQKLAGIGTTAAMLAHEFNNLFSPVLAYARQALDGNDTELMKTALTKTVERVEIMRKMSDRMIDLAKQPAGVIKAVNIRQIVDNAIGCLIRDLDKDNISVNIQIDPALAVRANENQLLQVMFNLVINARQAMLGRRGRLAIDAAPTRDGYVEINVRDTGCGISPENLPSIFEPFFSTKQDADRPDRKGLGLGLSICRDIIEELGGQIDVASEENVGTTFTLTLPQTD